MQALLIGGSDSESGERALERSTVCRCSVRREHDLDRRHEQRPQSFDDLLARNALVSDSCRISRPRPKSTSASPATTARRLSIQSTRSLCSLPGKALMPIGSRSPAAYRSASPPSRRAATRRRAAAAGLLGSDAVLPHEVVCGVGRREDGRAEALDQALGVPFVPRRGEHHHRLAVGRELGELPRHGERVEEEQPGAVVDRARRDVWSHHSLGVQSGCGACQCHRTSKCGVTHRGSGARTLAQPSG